MKKTGLTIVLLNWNGYEDTKQCLESIYKNRNVSFNVILIDNGSVDNSASRLCARFKDLELVEFPENIGFAAGSNVGLRRAVEEQTGAVLLLNDDTILAENCLQEMLICLHEDPQFGAVVPKIYYQHNSNLLWYAGGEISWWKVSVKHFGFRQKDNGKWDKPKSIEFATGCAVLLKTDVINQIGYLDETFFSYHEDVDYSLRLQQAGFTIQYCPGAVLWHKVGAGTKSEKYSPFYLYYQTRNRVFAFCRNKSAPYRFYVHFVNFVVYFLLRILMIFFKAPLGEKKVQTKAVFYGYMDSWKNKLGRNKSWEAL